MKLGMFWLVPRGQGRGPTEIFRNNLTLIELAEEHDQAMASLRRFGEQVLSRFTVDSAPARATS